MADREYIIQPIILSGGPGSRLYPMSDNTRPKPFISIRGKSLLRSAYDRVRHVSPDQSPIIITNQDYVQETLNHVESNVIILAEPCRKDTAPAICAAINWHQLQCEDPTRLYLVCAADHHIPDSETFKQYVLQAVPIANEGFVVTFGIDTASPETGYGYIHRGKSLYGDVYQVQQFVEKPPLAQAIEYCEHEDYYWNSGIFLLSGATLLTQIKHHQPYISMLLATLDYTTKTKNIIHIGSEFDQFPTESFDYALMEKLESVAVVSCKMKWSDVGTWHSMWEISSRDDDGNYVEGKVNVVDTRNCYIVSKTKTVMVVGCHNLAIIDDVNTLLIVPYDKSQQVKELVARYCK